MEEEPLSGGNTTVVVRVGDTVRRPVGHWSPAVHRLLRHLETAGFEGAPRVLGIDEVGREVLGFVPGDVGTHSPENPLAAWFRTPEASHAVGAWIRQFQTAQSGYRPIESEPWRRAPGRALAPGEVIVHHDVSPYNAVHRPDGRLTVVDWDFARPGGELEDLAWAAWRWVPLMAETWWHTEYGVGDARDLDPRRRDNLDALCEGFGLVDSRRGELGDEILRQVSRHADDLEDLARTDPAFARLLERDYAAAARADARWLTEHRTEFGLF